MEQKLIISALFILLMLFGGSSFASDITKISEVYASIEIGSDASEIVSKFGMECPASGSMCSSSAPRSTWVGRIGELDIDQKGGKVTTIIASYASGDFDALLALLKTVYGTPKTNSSSIMTLHTQFYDWESGEKKISLIQNSGTDIYGRPLKIAFSLLVN